MSISRPRFRIGSGAALSAALASATLAACAVEAAPTEPGEPAAPAEAVAVQASTPAQNVNQAEATFRSAVASNVAASASAAGVPITSSQLQQAHVPRNRTLATAPTTRSSFALFLSRSVARPSGSYAPGLYELSSSSTGGAIVRFHGPTGVVTVPPPPPPPAAFHTPLGDDLCGGAPGFLYDYCQELVACWAYDLYC